MDPLPAYSRETIARGSKSFALAARLFDRRTRARALLLYAWCRHCDDQIDGQELGAEPQQPERSVQESRLQAIHRQTRAAIAGETQEHPAFRGLQQVMLECQIPPRYPLELLEGLAMDVRGERYRTLADTLRYCYHVAGTVGAMMARVMGVADPPTLTRGIHLGIGLQLTNIARDVMDDARVGRVYLPSEWLEEERVEPNSDDILRKPENASRVAARLLDAAEPYYASAECGVARLPFRSAWAVNTAARVYREIGTLVRAGGADPWSSRVAVPTGRKLALLLQAGAGAVKLRRRADGIQPPDASSLWAPAETEELAYPSKR